MDEMPQLDKTDLLMGLGLSPNQAKVYQSILKSGNSTVGDLAKSCGVRREDVYKVLPILEKMGLVEEADRQTNCDSGYACRRCFGRSCT